MHNGWQTLNKVVIFNPLTHYLADGIFSCIFIQIKLKIALNGKLARSRQLIYVMGLHQTSAKPLPEPMMTQFADKYMHLYAS